MYVVLLCVLQGLLCLNISFAAQATSSYTQRLQQQEQERRERQIFEENQRKERLAQEEELYQTGVLQLIDRFNRIAEAPGQRCWVERDCSDTYTKVFDEVINDLNRNYGYDQSVRSVGQRLATLKQSVRDHIRTLKMGFGTYILSVLSDEALSRLQRGERLEIPSDDKLKKILPGDLSKTDLEILLFEVSEQLEKSQKYDMVSSVKEYFVKMTHFINLLPQGHPEKRHLLDRLDKLKATIQERDYLRKILHFLNKTLPEQQRTPTLRETKHSALLKVLRHERKVIDAAQKTYAVSKAFKDNHLDKRLAEEYKALYTLVYKFNDKERRCTHRADCLKSIILSIKGYVEKLPDVHPLRKDMANLIKNIQEHVRYYDTFNFAEALFAKMPTAVQSDFKIKKFPSPDKLTDKEFQEAMTRKDASKRLTTGHIMMMMLQKIVEQDSVKNQQGDYDQRIAAFKGMTDKFLDRLERIALKVNKKSAAEIESLKDLVSDLVMQAHQNTPKRAVLEYLYDMIPEKYRTEFDVKKGSFVEGKKSGHSFFEKGIAQHPGLLSAASKTSKVPNAPATAPTPHTLLPHEKPAPQGWDRDHLTTTGKKLDVIVFPGEDPKKQHDKKKKDPNTKDITKNLGGKVQEALGGFLDKALGGLFGGVK